MELLQFIANILKSIIDFIPRFKIIQETDGGVSWRFGIGRELRSGALHWYWPVIEKLDVLDKVKSTYNLPSQSLITRDGQKVLVKGLVVHSFKSCLKSFLEYADPLEAVRDITLIAISRYVTHHTYPELIEIDKDKMSSILREEVANDLTGLDIVIHSVTFESFSKNFVLSSFPEFPPL